MTKQNFLLKNRLLFHENMNNSKSKIPLVFYEARKMFAILIFLLISISAFAQNERQIKGIVQDTLGNPISGVTIKVSAPEFITQTDNRGDFTLNQVNDNSVLTFTYKGFEDYQVTVGNQNFLQIILKESNSDIDEVVVVAFGTQKKSEVVGSVSTIKPSNLRVPSSNLTTALAGQAAGIIAYQRSGEPGQDNADFFIRGVASFGTGKVNPLILIDGMELSTTELARLRPDDIESFTIMKDASSTSLYGARGANGVIYVVTKQGKEGAASISFRAESSFSSPTRNVEFADPVRYMELYNDAQVARNPFEPALYSREKIDMTREGVDPVIFPAVDWRSYLFKESTLNHRYNLNVNGGGKVARYYVAGSYAKDNGVLRVNGINNFNNNIDLQSYTLRANVNINLTKSTELIVRLNGNFDDYTGPLQGGAEIYNTVIRSNPVDFLPFYEKDEEHQHVQHILFGGVKGRSYLNPYADMVKGYKDYTRSLMMAQMELKQDLNFITEGLKFRTMFNTNRVSRYDIERAYKPFFYAVTSYDKRTLDYQLEALNESSGEEFLSFTLNPDLREQNSVFYMESALSYNKTFNNKHNLSSMLVAIMRSGTDARAGSLQLSLPSRNMGVSGRATYSYDNKYFGEFNFGYNGSERFYKDKRFGFFPSVGAAWNIANENFWQNLQPVINNFKLRGTYGLVGNDAIGSVTDRFFYLSNVDMNSAGRSAFFGREYGYGLNGINVTRYSNPDITWEKSYKTNIALEVGILNKFNLLIDYFTEKRTNILMDRVDIPSTMGLTAPVRANVGQVKGNGLEFSLDYSDHFSNGMWIQARGNFTYATNKISVYEEPTYEKEWWKSRVGYSLSQQWGYIAERLFVDDNEVANSPVQNFGVRNIAGDIKYKDVNGDGQITQLDLVPIGLPITPEIIYGGGLSLGYKNFDLSAFFQGSAQSSFWMGGFTNSGSGAVNLEPFVGGKQILKAFADNHYSLDNPDLYALYPRLSTQSQVNNVQSSTKWIRDGAFLRLKQAEIGYSLPSKIVDRIKAKTARFYVSGSNLLLMSGFKLWDIEMGGNGLGYPLQRVYNLGINMSF